MYSSFYKIVNSFWNKEVWNGLAVYLTYILESLFVIWNLNIESPRIQKMFHYWLIILLLGGTVMKILRHRHLLYLLHILLSIHFLFIIGKAKSITLQPSMEDTIWVIPSIFYYRRIILIIVHLLPYNFSFHLTVFILSLFYNSWYCGCIIYPLIDVYSFMSYISKK